MATLFDILAFAIFIAGILSIVRWNVIDKSFRPFILLVWLACINETLGYALAANGFTTTLNTNIYLLSEALTVIWFFYKQGIFKNTPGFGAFIAILFFCLWFIETFIWKSRYGLDLRFQIIYSIVIVLISIHAINQLLEHNRSGLLNDPLFLICIGFISYFTFTAFVHILWYYAFTKSITLLQNIFFIKLAINFISNIIYAFAVLRMPVNYIKLANNRY